MEVSGEYGAPMSARQVDDAFDAEPSYHIEHGHRLAHIEIHDLDALAHLALQLG
jgi:hypothetical protein